VNGTERAPRLIVGISRSPASWWALAWAVGEARRRGVRLLLVNVFRPPVVPAANADCVAYGNALIRTAIDQAVGRMSGDVSVKQEVISGRPAVELADLARGGDLLVLGSRHRGWLRRHAPGSIARACARRADCPVVIVPEPWSKSLPVLWTTDSVRGHRFRRVPHRGAQAT